MPIKLNQYSAQVNPVAGTGNAMITDPASLIVQDKTGDILQKASMKGMEIVGEYEHKKDQARQLTEKGNLEVAILEKMTAWKDGIKNRTDYQNFGTEYKDFTDTSIKQLQSSVSPEVWEKMEPYVKKSFIEGSIQTKALADHKEITGFKMDFLTKQYPTWQKEYVNTGDPAIIENVKNSANGLVNIGVMEPNEAAKYINTFARVGDTKRAEAFIVQNGVKGWSGLQDKTSRFPNMQPEDWLHINGIVKSQIVDEEHAIRKHQEEVEYKANEIMDGKGSVQQKVAAIHALGAVDSATGFHGLNPRYIRSLVNEVQREGKTTGGGGEGSNLIFLDAHDAASEGELTSGKLLELRGQLKPAQYIRVKNLNERVIKNKNNSEFKAYMGEIKNEENQFKQSVSALPKELKNVAIADFDKVSQMYTEAHDKDAKNKLQEYGAKMLQYYSGSLQKQKAELLVKRLATNNWYKDPKNYAGNENTGAKGKTETKSKSVGRFKVEEVK